MQWLKRWMDGWMGGQADESVRNLPNADLNHLREHPNNHLPLPACLITMPRITDMTSNGRRTARFARTGEISDHVCHVSTLVRQGKHIPGTEEVPRAADAESQRTRTASLDPFTITISQVYIFLTYFTMWNWRWPSGD